MGLGSCGLASSSTTAVRWHERRVRLRVWPWGDIADHAPVVNSRSVALSSVSSKPSTDAVTDRSALRLFVISSTVMMASRSSSPPVAGPSPTASSSLDVDASTEAALPTLIGVYRGSAATACAWPDGASVATLTLRPRWDSRLPARLAVSGPAVWALVFKANSALFRSGRST